MRVMGCRVPVGHAWHRPKRSGDSNPGFEVSPLNNNKGLRNKPETFIIVKRVMGIEPTYPAWKAGVLPLNYTRNASTHYSVTMRYCQVFYKSSFTQRSSSFISIVGSKRATTSPSRLTTNFVKFHLISGLFL